MRLRHGTAADAALRGDGAVGRGAPGWGSAATGLAEPGAALKAPGQISTNVMSEDASYMAIFY